MDRSLITFDPVGNQNQFFKFYNVKIVEASSELTVSILNLSFIYEQISTSNKATYFHYLYAYQVAISMQVGRVLKLKII